MGMSDTGEERVRAADGRRLRFEQTVYDEHGEKLGTIRGFDDDGFYVTAEEGVVPLETEHARGATPGAGEMDLMWRCWECGELGRIADIPEECPSCGAPKEDIYYWTED